MESEALKPVHLIDAVRTPIGKLRGALSSVRPDDLGAQILRALLERNPDVPVSAIEDVAFGNVNQAGEDNRNVARMASLLAGFPVETAGVTINRLCGSGLDALLHCYRSIATGEISIGIAGGVESMSRAPFVIARPSGGFPSSLDVADSMIGWRFVNPEMPSDWTQSMGHTAELLAGRYSIGRQRQDEFALRSHQKAVDASAGGLFDEELVPVCLADGTKVTMDEGPRPDASIEALNALRPAFQLDGSVTAGNSSSVNDGASAALLVSDHALSEFGLVPMATVLGGSVAGVSPDLMGIGPVPATKKLLGRLGWELHDIAAVELNEAFAAQSLAVLNEWNVADDWSVVNSEGGAIALGHPLGCSGVRIVATLAHRLRRRGGGLGLATMCIGVGQGIALLIEGK
jgi:acetyl-CoA acyltransferase